jgi:hypothetical protein
MTLDSHRRVTEGFPLVAKTVKWCISHYLRTEADQADWRASPLRVASRRDTAPDRSLSEGFVSGEYTFPKVAERRYFNDALTLVVRRRSRTKW